MEAVNKLLNYDYEVLAVEQAEKSISLDQFIPAKNKKYGIVFGNEVKGVEQEVIDRCKGCIEIPQLGTKHSLNIAVSAGIVLWDLYNKMILNPVLIK